MKTFFFQATCALSRFPRIEFATLCSDSSERPPQDATLGACIIQAGLIAVCFSPTPSTIHPTLLWPSLRLFFSPAGCWIGIFCGSYYTGKLYRLQPRSLVLLPLGVFPSLASRRAQREKARIPGIRYSPLFFSFGA